MVSGALVRRVQARVVSAATALLTTAWAAGATDVDSTKAELATTAITAAARAQVRSRYRVLTKLLMVISSGLSWWRATAAFLGVVL
jgi:hypothetical protein